MAHTFLDPNEVAQVANALVRKDLVLGGIVGRNVAANFRAGMGASVDIKKPATLTASTRALGSTASISTGTLTEAYQTVSITEQAYSAVDLSDADMTLHIADFAEQVLAPQAVAIGEYIETAIASKLATVTASTALGTYVSTSPDTLFVAARKYLRNQGTPINGMIAVVGTDIYADLLNSGKLSDVDTSGSDSALRDATVGRLRGFTIIESNRVPGDELYFFHRDAVQLVLRAPAQPRGAAYAASVAQDGHAITWIMDYDSDTLHDRSVLSVFVGVGLITVRTAGGVDLPAVLRVDTGS